MLIKIKTNHERSNNTAQCDLGIIPKSHIHRAPHDFSPWTCHGFQNPLRFSCQGVCGHIFCSVRTVPFSVTVCEVCGDHTVPVWLQCGHPTVPMRCPWSCVRYARPYGNCAVTVWLPCGTHAIAVRWTRGIYEYNAYHVQRNVVYFHCSSRMVAGKFGSSHLNANAPVGCIKLSRHLRNRKGTVGLPPATMQIYWKGSFLLAVRGP